MSLTLLKEKEMKKIYSIVLIMLVALAGCGTDGPTMPNPIEPGDLSISYVVSEALDHSIVQVSISGDSQPFAIRINHQYCELVSHEGISFSEEISGNFTFYRMSPRGEWFRSTFIFHIDKNSNPRSVIRVQY